MIVAIARIPGNPAYLQPILLTAIDGIRMPTVVEPDSDIRRNRQTRPRGRIR